MAIQSQQAALQPSSFRPVPLRRRDDLVIQEIAYKEAVYPVIKDPVGLKYFRLQPEQYVILSLLDGQRNIEELRDGLQMKFPTVHVTASDVQRLIGDLHEKGLLTSDRLGQGQQLVAKGRKERWKQVRQAVMNPLYIRLPGWDPERTLRWLQPYCCWIFGKPAVIIAMTFVAFSWLFFGVQFDSIQKKLPEFQQFFGWPNLLYLWGTMAVTKILHEFGHGLACRHFGSECHSMGMMLLVFSPTLYCDVTDSWMLKSKWQRIYIAAAGMYFEVIIAAFALLIWYGTQPGLINNLALNTFFVTTVTTVIFNANPLLRYDGYYMMADWLEIPNLRAKATKHFQQTLAWWCFGIEPPDDPFMPTKGKFWFVLYAIASAIYRWVILFSITFFLYTVLKPYRLQSIGITVAVASVASIVGNLLWSFFKMVTAPKQDPVSKLKVIITCSLLIGTIAFLLRIPVPWYEEASFYVEPVGVEHVYSALPGQLQVIHAHPGDEIQAGDVLITLSNPDLEDQRDKLIRERDARATDIQLYRQLGRPDEQRLSERSVQTLNERISDLEKQMEYLKVSSSISGKVVAAPQAPQSQRSASDHQLDRWSGTPLDDENLGAILELRTHICDIAPSDKLQAVILINQADRRDLAVGDPIRLKLDLHPDQVFDGIVQGFSDRELEFAPPALSNKYGGPLATVSDPTGRERLNEPVFQAIVQFDAPMDQVRTGVRGRARFVVAKRTAWEWFWRWFRQTFNFRL